MAISIDVRDDVPQAAIDDVVKWLHHVDLTFSTHKPESPVSRFGHGELTLADLSQEVLNVFELCDLLYDDTDGAFDVTSVQAPNGSRFDPSGVVKGWSIERAAAMLDHHGAHNFCVNAGGDVVVRGEPTPGRPWNVGVRNPRDRDAVIAVVPQRHHGAVATSGTYERGAHIYDPETGIPTAKLASVTIVGPSLTYADAYATTVFVKGVEGLVWLEERHPQYSGMVVTHDGKVLSTRAFPRPEA